MSSLCEDTELRIAPLAEFAHWISDIAQWLHAQWHEFYPGDIPPRTLQRRYEPVFTLSGYRSPWLP